MTAKQKAEEMYVHYLSTVRFNMEDCSFTYRDDIYELCTRKTAKRCALIAVDTVLWMASHYATIEYWQEVKQEIEKL